MERVFADLFLDAHGTPPEEMVLDLDTDDPLLQRQLGPPKKTAVRQHRSSSAAHAVDGLGPRGRLLGREVFYRHLDNRREVASSFGLTHSPYNSGGMRSDQGMGKAGNSRALAIELAWPWVRHQPQSALAHRFRERVGTTTGRIRRIAIVALACKLMIALWRYLTSGMIPEGAVMKPI